MKNHFSSLLLVCALTILTSCSPIPTSRPSDALENISETPSDRTLEYQKDLALLGATAEAPRPYDVLKYEVQGAIHWTDRVLTAQNLITLTFTERTTVVELDSRVTQVYKVEIPGSGMALSFEAETNSGILKIRLPENAPGVPGAQLQLKISYLVDTRHKNFSRALKIVLPRAGDPITSKVAYTASEPQSTRAWMPCNDRPSDRAYFSMSFTLPEGESFISNGHLLGDQPLFNGLHRTSYATRYTLPTYLMAFAVGEFETATRYKGALPVSIWARKGLPVDYSGLLAATVQQIQLYEKLLIPYPYEKYTIVLLPDFGAQGIEHASITFNAEERSSSSQVIHDLSLMAHELAHQWFGDYVTVKSWDDLWIKEGMATLLAAQAARSWKENAQELSLNGSEFAPEKGDAMWDPELTPDEKYTSGPYDRSAWFLTQLRALLGEKNFWSVLKQVLAKHAWGTIGTEEFLEEFKPYLDEATFLKAKQAIAAKELPSIEYERPGKLKVTDSAGALLTPLTISLQSAQGPASHWSLPAGEPVQIPSVQNSVLALDYLDVHPDYETFISEGNPFWNDLKDWGAPQNAEELKAYLALPPQAQIEASDLEDAWNFGPEQFKGVYSAVKSEAAQFLLLARACESALTQKEERESPVRWFAVLRYPLRHPPFLGASTETSSLYACKDLISTDALTDKWDEIKNDPEDLSFGQEWLHFLSYLPLSSEEALDIWKPLAQRGATVRARLTAISALKRHLHWLIDENQSRLPPERLEDWRTFGSDLVLSTRVGRVIGESLSKIFVPIGSPVFFEPLVRLALDPEHSAYLRNQAVCTGYVISNHEADKTATWAEFVKSLGNPSTLPPMIQKTLNSPQESCKNFDDEEE